MKPWVLVRNEQALRRLGGRTLLGRILEMLRRENCPAAGVICPDELAARVEGEVSKAVVHCRVVSLSRSGSFISADIDSDSLILLLDAGTLYDQRLIKMGLGWEKATVLVDSKPHNSLRPQPKVQGHSFAGVVALPSAKMAGLFGGSASVIELARRIDEIEDLTFCDIEELPRYHLPIRRALRPFWIPIEDKKDVKLARWTLAKAMSKGHMEWLVYVLNRPTETFLSYYIAETPITPNQITIACNLVAFGVTALFVLGHLWFGVILALVVGILDGLDGRQARIQIKTSKLGELEHVFDKVYEVSWIAALGWHFSGGMEEMPVVWAALGWIAAHFIDGGAYTFYRAKRGMMLDEVTKLDALIRFFAGCRNTSTGLLVIGLAVGYPLEFFWGIVWLNVATTVIHWIRTAMLLLKQEHA